MHGKVFRCDDPFWDSFYPPNGFNCRCDVIPLTDDEIKDIEHYTLQPKLDKDGQPVVINGIPQYERVLTKIEKCESTPSSLTQRDAQVTIDGKQMKYKRAFYQDDTMANAVSTDRGWNYNPGKAVYFEPDLTKYDKQFVDAYLEMKEEFIQNLSKKHQSSANIAKTLTSVVNGAKIINNIANVAGVPNSLKTAEEYIEDIKQFDWWKGLTKEDAIAFEEDLKKVSPERLSLLQKYCKDMKIDFYSTKGSFNSPSENKIYIKDFVKNRIDSEIRGFKRKSHCFLHETGHWLDHNMIQEKVLSENLPELRKKLNDDIFNYVNKVLEKKDNEKIKNLKQLKELS
ncbi:MAG: hypothetical protein IKP67_01610, partial [Spirochaetales bacterium]|nr:hypothetical protein [Spirochaetales bacterium]